MSPAAKPTRTPRRFPLKYYVECANQRCPQWMGLAVESEAKASSEVVRLGWQVIYGKVLCPDCVKKALEDV